MTTTHRMSKSPTYLSWRKMRERCFNSNAMQYPYYGGRGITVCKRWSKFENFLDDMGTRPEGMTLDRLDHDKDYGPKNCRWIDWENQRRNQRKTILHNGEPISVIAVRLGIPIGTIKTRIYTHGESVSSAIRGRFRRRKLTPERLREYARLRKRGIPREKIAAGMSVKIGTLNYWLTKAKKAGYV